ncbi:MAG: 50S ribosomal protein L4 [Acidimicrobiales bacterium]
MPNARAEAPVLDAPGTPEMSSSGAGSYPRASLYDPDGASAGSIELDAVMFGCEPHAAVMHQVVVAQLAAARSGTHSTLTRAEVRGGGSKPWRQKGTGRARQGSTRAPQWKGGGVAFGPKPRDYRQRTPKRMISLALRSALSDRAGDGRVVVIDRFDLTVPSTKQAASVLSKLGVAGRVLVVLSPDDEVTAKSLRNMSEVTMSYATQLTAYDVLCCDWMVFTRRSLPGQPPTAGHSAPAEGAEQPASSLASASTGGEHVSS